MKINVKLASLGMTETNRKVDVPEKAYLLAAEKTPFRKLSTSGDEVSSTLFLAYYDSNFLSGETINVNGGKIML